MRIRSSYHKNSYSTNIIIRYWLIDKDEKSTETDVEPSVENETLYILSHGSHFVDQIEKDLTSTCICNLCHRVDKFEGKEFKLK